MNSSKCENFTLHALHFADLKKSCEKMDKHVKNMIDVGSEGMHKACFDAGPVSCIKIDFETPFRRVYGVF